MWVEPLLIILCSVLAFSFGRRWEPEALTYVVTATVPYESTDVIGVFFKSDAAKKCADNANRGKEDYLYHHAAVRAWNPYTGECVDDDVYWVWLRKNEDGSGTE